MARDLDLRGRDCQCIACDEVFVGMGAFDAHQRWSGIGDAAKLTCSLEGLSPVEAPNGRRYALPGHAGQDQGATDPANDDSEVALSRTG